MVTPGGPAWLEPLPGGNGFWLEITGERPEELGQAAPRVLPIVAALLEAERQRALVAEELAGRYEEIDLLYAISEILGRTVRLEEAAQIIVREVSAVVGARRASIMVYDEASRTLRTVAARGFAPEGLVPVNVDDASSVAARVFREQRILTFDPTAPGAIPSGSDERGISGQLVHQRAHLLCGPGQRAPLRRRHQSDRPDRG